MASWEQWRELARESARAAGAAEAILCYRSAASRYYYAAYQAATTLLLYRGLTPPADREAWTHDETPVLIARETGRIIRSRERRGDIAKRLRGLYQLRITADYQAGRTLSAGQVVAASRDARYILSTIEGLLPQGEER